VAVSMNLSRTGIILISLDIGSPPSSCCNLIEGWHICQNATRAGMSQVAAIDFRNQQHAGQHVEAARFTYRTKG
jgi:hypothetical protein